MSPPDTVPSDGPRLLGDVGGTHARFAWQDQAGAAITRVRVYPSADFPSLQDGVRHYLADMAQPVPPQAAIGIANPVHGDQVQMTNHHWSFSIQALQQALGLQRLVVVNDFVALALAVPTLAPGEWQPLAGAAQPGEGAPIALIGPGTGLGVAGLLPQQGRWTAVPSEGGHATLSPETEREWQVVQWLQARHGGHASIERAVSGPGLVNLYQALRTLDGVDRPDGPPAAPPPSPADVTERARYGSDPTPRRPWPCSWPCWAAPPATWP